MAGVGRDGRAVERVAQVDNETGQDHHDSRCAHLEQLHQHELRRTSKNHRGHGLRIERGKPCAGSQNTVDHAEGCHPQQDGKLGSDAAQELGFYGGMTGSHEDPIIKAKIVLCIEIFNLR